MDTGLGPITQSKTQTILYSETDQFEVGLSDPSEFTYGQGTSYGVPILDAFKLRLEGGDNGVIVTSHHMVSRAGSIYVGKEAVNLKQEEMLNFPNGGRLGQFYDIENNSNGSNSPIIQDSALSRLLISLAKSSGIDDERTIENYLEFFSEGACEPRIHRVVDCGHLQEGKVYRLSLPPIENKSSAKGEIRGSIFWPIRKPEEDYIIGIR